MLSQRRRSTGFYRAPQPSCGKASKYALVIIIHEHRTREVEKRMGSHGNTTRLDVKAAQIGTALPRQRTHCPLHSTDRLPRLYRALAVTRFYTTTMHLFEDPRVGETSPADWKYIAEGGATLVLSYDGSPNPKFTGTVLRLRKADIHVVFEDAPQFWSEPEDPIIQFQDEVIERLLLPENLPRLQRVDVERPWLEQIADRIEEQRPAKRREKDKIDLSRHKAVLATDLVGGKGWAVEIKVNHHCIATLNWHF